MNPQKIIGIVVVMVIALILAPVIFDLCADIAATATGTAVTVINMVPVFYILTVLGIGAYAIKTQWGGTS